MPQYRNVKEFLDRIKDAHGQYRAEYIAAAEAYTKNKATWEQEMRRGWPTHAEHQAAAEKNRIKTAELRKALEDVEARAAAAYDTIRNECIEIFEPYNRANPAHLDMATLELLKAGVYKDNELLDLANQYADNITMLRLIGKHAESRAEGGRNAAMQTLANRCAASVFPYLEPVDALIFWSKQDIRAEKNEFAKDNAIGKSNALAGHYETEADKIIAKAEADNIYISIPTPGDADYKA